MYRCLSHEYWLPCCRNAARVTRYRPHELATSAPPPPLLLSCECAPFMPLLLAAAPPGEGHTSAATMRQVKRSAVSGRSPSTVYLRSSEVVTTIQSLCNQTHSIDLPLGDVLAHNLLDQVRIPPHLGVVLQLGPVERDAPRLVDAERRARPPELPRPQLPEAVVVARRHDQQAALHAAAAVPAVPVAPPPAVQHAEHAGREEEALVVRVRRDDEQAARALQPARQQARVAGHDVGQQPLQRERERDGEHGDPDEPAADPARGERRGEARRRRRQGSAAHEHSVQNWTGET
ncbi:uncharacterized protein E0L32_002493 [Thyridium curvatum]|uniref:Uncharacterized protein n=1 Tax=Thyridium curvatum TaxID=1093900 RepID=A0A507BGZ6_9PEZI|nr:uncharacterized protein E0L32_002493 [Thyridium curvatum]TPX18636.1 hypothetical protein E0L32_002493 [Thyridium curvatum]